MKSLKLLTVALSLLFLSTPVKAEMIWGQISSYNPEIGSITVKSEVMGLTGPEKRNISYKLDQNTLLNLCWDGVCNGSMALTALERLHEFDYFEADNLSIIGKEVQLQYGTETARIEVVNIVAPLPTYYFSPSDFVSTF